MGAIPDFDSEEFDKFMEEIGDEKGRSEASLEMMKELVGEIEKDPKGFTKGLFDKLRSIPKRDGMKTLLAARHYLVTYCAMVLDEISDETGKDVKMNDRLAKALMEMGANMVLLGIWGEIHKDDDVPEAFRDILK